MCSSERLRGAGNQSFERVSQESKGHVPTSFTHSVGLYVDEADGKFHLHAVLTAGLNWS